MPSLRGLPSVDRLAGDSRLSWADTAIGRASLVTCVRSVLAEVRGDVLAGAPMPDFDDLVALVHESAMALSEPGLLPVINATGVIIHTNLGRAPLAQDAIRAMQMIAAYYNTLEYDRDLGVRGSRDRYVERLLCHLTRAEAALAVNNNAAALLLVLSTLAAGKEAIISRGQAVEIGGGFRIPDVMRQSGSRLVEVGTTNRTRIGDYAAAITPETAVLMRVHSSNFRVIGFTEEASLESMVALAQQHNAVVVDDVGSGALLDVTRFGMAAEPIVQASVAAGAGIVCFSGDKLLGGPQAGLIVGKKHLIDRIRRHPLARAVRIDKLTLAALLATLRHYVKGDAETTIPIWKMIAAPAESLARRATFIASSVGGEVIPGLSTVGGGSLPGETLPTSLVAITTPSPNAVLAALRSGQPPVIAGIEHDRVVVDPRTLFQEQDAALIDALLKATGQK